jgi:membrane-bound inhibitor of C-type lysozyme
MHMGELLLASILGIGGDVSATSMQVMIAMSGDAAVKTAIYECEGVAEPFAVKYLNSNPNFLAIVPVGGAELIFVNVLSGSGARYVAGSFEWSTKGSDATFSDLQHPDSAPVTCLERVETP